MLTIYKAARHKIPYEGFRKEYNVNCYKRHRPLLLTMQFFFNEKILLLFRSVNHTRGAADIAFGLRYSLTYNY